MNAVTVNNRTCFRISAAFGVVLFAKSKLKITVGGSFSVVSDAIQWDSFRVNMVMLEGPNEQTQRSIFIQRMGTRGLRND